VFTHAKQGALLIDCSTIDVTTARAVIADAEAKGFEMIDAPVSGGVGGAAAGTLTFMCGGTKSAYERAEPFLDMMGKNIFHAGNAGNGQVAKICNNMLLGIHMIGTCEAFNLAEKLGLDAQTFAGFAAAMMLKDLRLAQEAATTARAATPLGAQSESIYALMEAAGKDDLDFSAVILKLIDCRTP